MSYCECLFLLLSLDSAANVFGCRCMKSGELVESGTHQELMTKGGEYSRLYAVQARAFTDAVEEIDGGHATDGSDRGDDAS